MRRYWKRMENLVNARLALYMGIAAQRHRNDLDILAWIQPPSGGILDHTFNWDWSVAVESWSWWMPIPKWNSVYLVNQCVPWIFLSRRKHVRAPTRERYMIEKTCQLRKISQTGHHSNHGNITTYQRDQNSPVFTPGDFHQTETCK